MSVRVDINHEAIRELLTSGPVLRDLRKRADRIAEAAGDGFVVAADDGSRRDRVAVIAASPHARYGEAKDHRLLRAIDAGRG